MTALTRADLMPLERYAEDRSAFRTRVMELKRNRKLALNEHIVLLFENRETIRYQIQEMLHIERIFEPLAIQEELDTYNPLIPDGHHFKATLLIEYPDVAERRRELERLKDMEHALWVTIGDERAAAIANEDLDRSNDTKTSAVHFLRYPLSDGMLARAADGAAIRFGCDHPDVTCAVEVPPRIREGLLGDLT